MSNSESTKGSGKRSSGLPIHHGQATLYAPTVALPYYRVAYTDPTTGKRRTTTAGKNREAAITKAAILLGHDVPGAKRGTNAPTLQEVVDSWLQANTHRWSSRTLDHYHYLAKKLTTPLGAQSFPTITPTQIRAIPTGTLSRGQQERLRTITRGIWKHGSEWLQRPAEDYAQAVTITGSKSAARSETVERDDIPGAITVAALINTAYSTLQISPLDDPETTTYDPITGEKSISGFHLTYMQGIGLNDPLSPTFRAGLPKEYTDAARRGVPKHYTNHEERMERETRELASRYRQQGLAMALGAGGGLRIGEVLALRVRHILTIPQTTAFLETGHPKHRALKLPGIAAIPPWRGEIHVEEQCSQGSRGKIYLSLPKGGRTRTTHLPAYLPNWKGEENNRRQRVGIATIIPRLGEDSLWSATQAENNTLWRAGYIPLGALLWRRLQELHQWITEHHSHLPLPQRHQALQDVLLFPTRNPARKTRDGRPHVLHEDNWTPRVETPEGSGTYQATNNYARGANPLYDYVSAMTNDYPTTRQNNQGRKGYTHHSLRHYAISSRLKAGGGAQLPLIAKEMGHAHAAFTLARYGHALPGGLDPEGFEF